VRTGLVTLLAVGCSFHPSLATDSGTTGGDGGLVGDGGGSMLQPATCAVPASLQDNFTEAMPTGWYTATGPGGMVTSGSGDLVLTVSGDMMSAADALAKHNVNLSGSALELEVPAVLGGSGVTGLSIGLDQTHYAGFLVAKNNLTSSIIDGANKSTHNATYDGSAQLWWRFREASGTLYVETSPDDATWTAQTSGPTPSWIAYTRPFVQGYGIGSAGTAQIAQLDTAYTAAPWCAADTLTDDFSGSDLQWLNETPIYTMASPCAYTLAAGAATIVSTMTTCYIGTSYAWDLTGSSVVIEWASTSAPNMMFQPAVMLASDTGTPVGVYVNGTQACYPDAATVGTTACITHAFDPANQDKYWRISESSGTLTFESSPDKNTWTTLAHDADPFPMDAVEIRLGAFAMGSGSGQVVFAGVGD
jgi:hypothetical protein